MALAAPEWLARRGGTLKAGGDAHTVYLMLSDQPLYAVVPVPVAGKFGCAIIQTNNGKRIECPSTAPSAQEALHLGLEEVRKTMGW
jgi:hypothetical protein